MSAIFQTSVYFVRTLKTAVGCWLVGTLNELSPCV